MRDRYETIRCRDLIDGYFIPRPNETIGAAFDRAKAELIANLERQLSAVRTFTVEEFGTRAA